MDIVNFIFVKKPKPVTVHFKVRNDTNALILNKVPGADGSIFDFTCPICETFPYRTRPVSFTLDLGKYFMGGYGHIPSKLYMFIRIEEPTPLTGAVELAPRGISKSIVGLKTRRKALLGDMDDKPLSRLDGCRLDIHYYGKIPAIVTVDAET